MKTPIAIAGLTLVLVACSPISKETKYALSRPVDCQLAQADVAELENAKVSGPKQALTAVQAFTPVGLVTGLLSGTEGDKIDVALGDHNEDLDQKISDIQSQCNQATVQKEN